MNVRWDDEDDPKGNVRHCEAHGVRREEVEAVFANPLGFDVSHSSEHPVVFGRTRAGRHLIVVYEELDPATVRPITAFEVPARRNP